MKKKLSIVLPVFNERKNIQKSIKSIFAQSKFLPNYEINIIISDGPSTDGTSELAKRIAKRNKRVFYLSCEKGLGIGLYKGHSYSLKVTKPDVMLQIDADGQVNPKVIVKLVMAIEEGNDLAIGSRFVKGGRNNLPLNRRIFSKGSSVICRTIMGPWDIQEFTNSARAFTPNLFKKINWGRIPWKDETFVMIPAFLNEAVIAGAKYKEVPLIFRNRSEGYSKNKVVSYTLNLILYAIKGRLVKRTIGKDESYII